MSHPLRACEKLPRVMQGKSRGGIRPRRDVQNIPDSYGNMIAKLQQSTLNESVVRK
jgi:hypothetical protein